MKKYIHLLITLFVFSIFSHAKSSATNPDTDTSLQQGLARAMPSVVSIYVELDEGEDNVTNVEDNFNKMLALTNVIGQINPAFVDIRTLIESAPISGSEKMVEFIDQMLQAQSQAGQEQEQMARQQQDIASTKGKLENIKIQRGMMNDEEKLRLENEKIRQKGLKDRGK